MNRISLIGSIFRQKHNCGPDSYVNCKESLRSELFSALEPIDSCSISPCFDRKITDFNVTSDARFMLVAGYFPSRINVIALEYPLHDNISPSITSTSSLKSPVTKLQWYPHDPGMFFSISKTKILCIWDTDNLKESHKVSLFDRPLCFEMSSVDVNHYCVAIGLRNSTIQTFNFKTGNFMMSLIGHRAPVTCISWSKTDGNIFSSGDSSGAILVWDIRNNKTFLKCLNQYENESSAEHGKYFYAHDGPVRALCSTFKTNSLISYSSDRTVKVWNMVSMHRLRSFATQTDVEYNACIDSTASHRNNTLIKDIIFIPGSKQPVALEISTGKDNQNIFKNAEYHSNSEINKCQLHPYLPCLFTSNGSRFIQVWMSQYVLKNKLKNPLYQDTWSDE